MPRPKPDKKRVAKKASSNQRLTSRLSSTARVAIAACGFGAAAVAALTNFAGQPGIAPGLAATIVGAVCFIVAVTLAVIALLMDRAK